MHLNQIDPPSIIGSIASISLGVMGTHVNLINEFMGTAATFGGLVVAILSTYLTILKIKRERSDKDMPGE